MRSLPRAYLFSWVVLLPVVGCGNDKPTASTPAETTTPRVEASGTRKWTYATATEAEEWGRRLEQAFAENDQRQLGLLVDWDAMAEEATDGLGTATMQKELKEGLVASTYGPNNLYNAMRAAGGEEMGYEFLRVKESKERPHVWFRMKSAAGVNYHDYVVVKHGDKIKAVDVYFMMSGERLSQTWRRGVLPLVTEKSKNWLQKLASAESEFVREFKTIEKFQQQVTRGNSEEALETYRSLPESVRRDKSLLLLRYRAANDLMDESEIIATAAEVQKTYPGDACLDLLLVDSLYMRQEYAEAIACIGRVEKVVGADSYLDFLRGTLYMEARDFPLARENFERAVQADSDSWEALAGLAQVGLLSADHQLTYDTLERLQEFEALEIDLSELPGYADFAASPQGQKWLAQNPQR